MSNFKRFGMGFISVDTKINSKIADIAIYEIVSKDSDFSDSSTKSERSPINTITDTSGRVIPMDDLSSDMVISAIWLNGGGNRISMPTFYQGELVEVYTYDGSDRYYFKGVHLEKDLRRKEIVTYAYSNLDKEKSFGEHFDSSTSYFFQVDTINKFVRLKTAVNDGEPVLWEAVIDSSKGNFKLLVDGKEKIIFDAVKDKLTFNIKEVESNCKVFRISSSGLIDFVGSTFKVTMNSLIISASTLFKKTTDFKSVCKFNNLSRTAIKKEPLD